MKPVTPAQRVRNVQGAREALELLYGPPITEDERRRAAEGLGREDYLPDVQPELPLAKAG